MKKNKLPEWSKTENLRWAFWGWDPLPYYRRLGRSSKPFFGNSRWCGEWRRRLHAEDTIKRMADLGVTMAITQFFKGYGLAYERELLDELATLVERFHENGVKVMGYTQLGSIFYETFLHEQPEARSWTRRDYEGRIIRWAGARYYRWEPCLNSEGFIDYMKEVIDYGYGTIGLDGYHFDNSYSKPCYCERCQQEFREYLAREVTDPERMGLTDFTFVEAPPMSKTSEVLDPLEQEWIKYRCHNAAEKFGVLYKHIKRLDENLCVHSNPAFPRAPGWARQWGVSPFHFAEVHDLLCAENSNFPRYEDDLLISQISAYRMGESLGYQTLPASWLSDPETGGHGLPREAAQIKLSLAEPAACGGCVGMNWALRTTGGDRLAIDAPEKAESVKRYIDFLDGNKELYRNAATLAPLALLHSFSSFAFGGNEVFLAYTGMEQALIQANIPYAVVFEENLESIHSFPLLVAPNQRCLSDDTVAKIVDFVAEGGKLIITGDSGRYDENNLERGVNGFDSIIDGDRVEQWLDIPEMSREMSEGSKWIRPYGSLRPERHKRVTDGIRGMLTKKELPFTVTGPDSLVVVPRSLPDGRIVLHLLNYDCAKKAENIRIIFESDFVDGKKYTILSPDEQSQARKGVFKAGNPILEVDSLEVYQIIEISSHDGEFSG